MANKDTEKDNNHGRLVDRINGFPQKVGGRICKKLIPSGNFPQQIRGRNWWIPTAGRMPLGPYFVNFGPSDQIFDPLYGENCLLKLVLVWGR